MTFTYDSGYLKSTGWAIDTTFLTMFNNRFWLNKKEYSSDETNHVGRNIYVFYQWKL